MPSSPECTHSSIRPDPWRQALETSSETIRFADFSRSGESPAPCAETISLAMLAEPAPRAAPGWSCRTWALL